MAVTKNPLIRYKILDRCFGNPYKRYFIADLIAACNATLTEIDPKSKGISRRQVLDDIAFMESSEGWSIDLTRHKEGKKVYYRYADTGYSINNMPLNEVEVSQLKSAIDILNQFTGTPQFGWVSELVPKLQAGLQTAQPVRQVINFDSNRYLKGIEWLSVLFNAITFNTVLDITYKDFKADAPYHIVLHPYYLKQYNNRWFLFGLNDANSNAHWNMALDRIEHIEPTSLAYKPNATDWEAYFDDVIGVTVPEDITVQEVVLRFYEDTARYVYNKPLHHSQKARWLNDEELEVRLMLKLNYELEHIILSYTGNVSVVKPTVLRYELMEKMDRGHDVLQLF